VNARGRGPRRRLVALALAGAAAAAPALAACARNPVTGRRELALISEEQEIALGREAAAQVQQSIGLVDDAALQQYVQTVGAALAATSQRPALPWTFRVVDDPTPNAFALPGGFIFLTRGMMNLMENEAELAGVLGHEIGHVTARHSVQQMSRAQLAQLGLGLGAILSPTVAQYGELAGTGLQLLFLKYGRDDERQADDLGFAYALDRGYDVREMDDVFASLQRVGDAEGRSPVPSWLATHPDPGERIERLQGRVASLDRPLAPLRVDEAEYLGRIDGLVFGENPRNGFFRQGVFVHPDLRFTLAVPSGWRAQNTPQAVVAVSPQQDAAVELTLAGTAGPEAAARQFLSQQGIRAGRPFTATVNGVPAVASYFEAQAQQGVVGGLVAFFGYGGRTYQVIGSAPAQRFAAYDAVIRQTLGSFAPLTDPALLAVRPDRLRVVRLDAPATPAELARRSGASVDGDVLAILNQVPSPATALPAGSLAKTVSSDGAARGGG
jgi:predicted Zn-dependent protease